MNPQIARQFYDNVIYPAIDHLGYESKSAGILLLGTALVESGLKYTQQLNGPALGYFQMEPDTHYDIWENYLQYRQELAMDVYSTKCDAFDLLTNLAGNPLYGAAMARVHYLRVPEAIPCYTDIIGLTKYYKKYYNTHLGASTVEKSFPFFKIAYDVITKE